MLVEEKQKRSCCTPQHVFRFIDSIFLIAAIAVQMTGLNFLMIHHDQAENKKLYFWFIGDIILYIIVLITLIISYRHVLVTVQKKLSKIDIPHIQVPMYGTLPFGYMSWLCYGGLLSAKVAVIFQNEDLITKLPDFGVFSTTNLKIILAITTISFILLINTEHDAEPNSDRSSYIGDLCKGVAFDLFDSIFFLGLLFEDESHIRENNYYNSQLRDTIIALSCINFLLPALSLMKLSLCDFGEQDKPITLSLVVKTVKLFCINLPYMIVRSYLYNTDPAITLFLVKNVLGVAVSLRYMIPEYVEACKSTAGKKSSSAVKPIHVAST